jgi:hypothetical protein
MSIEAMKQALGALETKGEHHERVYAAITALRQAIEQAEKQEPVAWMVLTQDDKKSMLWGEERPPIFNTSVKLIPLYAALFKREWVGLMDEEINDFDKKLRDHNDYCSLHFAWGISAKLKEKNNA